MIRKRLLVSVAVAGFILAAAAVLRYTQDLQIIDAEFARRTMQVIIGLILAVYGNFMPKDVALLRKSACATSRSQSVMRVGGWSMALAGIAYAGLWAFAPIAVADISSLIVVIAALCVMAGYCGWAVLSCRNARTA
jgi:hypothetical protein